MHFSLLCGDEYYDIIRTCDLPAIAYCIYAGTDSTQGCKSQGAAIFTVGQRFVVKDIFRYLCIITQN